MKKSFQYGISFLLILVATIACRDEDAVRFPKFQEGVNARLVLYPERSYINFADLNTASIAFDIYTESDLEELVYTVTYQDASLPEKVYPAVEAVKVPASAFVKGKATKIELTAAQLAAKFSLPGGISFLDGGDSFTFNAIAKLKDGRIFDAQNSAPSITTGTNASFTENFRVFVGCPSNIPNGVYIATQDDVDGWFGGASTKEVTITKVAGHPFNYIISDVSAGGYALCCLGFGYNANQPAQISDICTNIYVTGAAGSQISSGQGASAGSWNEGTQTLTVFYDDTFNGAVAGGFNLKSVFVKKP